MPGDPYSTERKATNDKDKIMHTFRLSLLLLLCFQKLAD